MAEDLIKAFYLSEMPEEEEEEYPLSIISLPLISFDNNLVRSRNLIYIYNTSSYDASKKEGEEGEEDKIKTKNDGNLSRKEDDGRDTEGRYEEHAGTEWGNEMIGGGGRKDNPRKEEKLKKEIIRESGVRALCQKKILTIYVSNVITNQASGGYKWDGSEQASW